MQRFRPLWAPLLACALPLALALALALPIAGRAAAQERTTATYDDWVVECVTAPGPPQKKTCQMVQAAQVKGRNQPFSLLIIEHPVRGKSIQLLVRVPVDVLLAAQVRIQTSDSDPGVTAPFEKCVPIGCIAKFEIGDAVLSKFRTAAKPGKVTFKIASGREISIPLSFKGFDQAFDALFRQ
jgi:invasion protein IalB